jgi:hypothetical protein
MCMCQPGACTWGLLCVWAHVHTHVYTHTYRKEYMPTPYTACTIRPYLHTWQYVGTSMVYMVCLSHDHTKVQVRTHGGATWWVDMATITPASLVLA